MFMSVLLPSMIYNARNGIWLLIGEGMDDKYAKCVLMAILIQVKRCLFATVGKLGIILFQSLSSPSRSPCQ